MKSPAELGRALFVKGDHDLQNARQTLAVGEPLDTVCFHLQQAAEKYLKGFLALQGIEYPHTHNLNVLFDLCGQVTDEVEPLRERFDPFAPYAVEMQYDDDLESDVGEVQAGVESVLLLRARIVSLTPEGMFAPLEIRPATWGGRVAGAIWQFLHRVFGFRNEPGEKK